MKRAKDKSNIAIVRDMLEGNRPFTQIGYTPSEVIHKEGDIWTDSRGKTWIKTDGGIRSHNPKADAIREEINKMWICKSCKADKRWSGDKYDEKFLAKTGRCYDCNIEYETDLKIKGKFKDYEKKKVTTNQLSYLLDIKNKLEEGLKYVLENKVIKFQNYDGVEKGLGMGIEDVWIDGSRDELISNLRRDLTECDVRISECKDILKKLEDVEL